MRQTYCSIYKKNKELSFPWAWCMHSKQKMIAELILYYLWASAYASPINYLWEKISLVFGL
jgi:hypothetical protein